MLFAGSTCVLFICIPGIWHKVQLRVDAQVKVNSMMAWTRVIAVGVVRMGQNGYILKVKPNGFPNRLDVAYASKSRVKDESSFLA